jgi:thioesterase domain-containing protein
VPRVKGSHATQREVKERLGGALPAYMVPSVVVWMEALPLTPNGKVDRTKLPAPAFESKALSVTRRAPDGKEAEMLSMWRELLTVPGLGVDDDFFVVGGTSLIGMLLMARIERVFGRRSELASLIRYPTVAQLTAALTQTEMERHSPIVPIRRGEGGRPLVCVHPIGGNVFCYLELADRLPKAASVIGIRAPVLVGGVVNEDLRGIASEYVAALREASVHGPYKLCGWSMGGVIAYEMARQLTAADEAVELLALVDARFPWRPDARRSYAEGDMITSFVRDVLASGGRPTALDLEQLAPGREEGLAERVLGLLRSSGVRAFSTPEELWVHYKAFCAHLRALHHYSPGPYEGQLSLFCADADGTGADECRRWATVAPRSRAVLLLEDHYSIVRGDAAEEIAAALSDVETAKTGLVGQAPC